MSTDTAAVATGQAGSQVAFAARAMRTPVIRQVFAGLADIARERGWTHEEYLAAVLTRQLASRESNGAHARIKAARFPSVKTLTEFNFDYQPAAPRELLMMALTCRHEVRINSATNDEAVCAASHAH